MILLQIIQIQAFRANSKQQFTCELFCKPVTQKYVMHKIKSMQKYTKAWTIDYAHISKH